VEIGPRKILNLEQVADRVAIDNSRDLKKALADRCLALTRHSIIETNCHVEPKFVDRMAGQQLDEERLSWLIKRAIADELGQHKSGTRKEPNIEETIQRAIVSNMGGLISSIRDEINSIRIAKPEQKTTDLPLDPEKFAELSQKSIDKLSGEIETGGHKKAKEVRIINKKSTSDLANELD
jgi:hypothetical protein